MKCHLIAIDTLALLVPRLIGCTVFDLLRVRLLIAIRWVCKREARAVVQSRAWGDPRSILNIDRYRASNQRYTRSTLAEPNTVTHCSAYGTVIEVSSIDVLLAGHFVILGSACLELVVNVLLHPWRPAQDITKILRLLNVVVHAVISRQWRRSHRWIGAVCIIVP